MRIPWRKQADRDVDERAPVALDRGPIETLESRLRERGVADADARSLAERLSADFAAQSRAARVGFVDGIAAGWHASSENRARLDRTLSEIKEVERLMGAFTGELSKLDEVLEVLAAYVRRMRTAKAETVGDRTLH